MSYEEPDFRTQVLKIALNDRKQLVQIGTGWSVKSNQIIHISRTRGRKEPFWGTLYCKQLTDARKLVLVQEHRLNGVKYTKAFEFAEHAKKVLEEILSFENKLATSTGMSYDRRRETTYKFYRRSDDLAELLTERNEYLDDKYVAKEDHADFKKLPRKLCLRCFYLYQKKKMNRVAPRSRN